MVSPRDVAAGSDDGETHSQPGEAVSALAVNPRDANQLLIAYEECAVVFLWDFAKRKVVKEYVISRRGKSAAVRTDESGEELCNSVQSLSWHSSGKRFAAGFKHGGFAIYRHDKNAGFYHTLPVEAPADEASLTPIRHLQWVCPPPHSRYAQYAGAIAFSGGRTASEKSLLSMIYPRNGSNPDDAMTELFKSDELAWNVTAFESGNHAEIAAFVVAQDQVDHCARIAPLSAIMLSGNPLDGCLPSVSVQYLPCFIKFRSNDQEEWEWKPEQAVEPVTVPPRLQQNPLKVFELINLTRSDGVLQDELISAWRSDKTTHSLLNGEVSDDFEWPINGGSITEPLLKSYSQDHSSDVSINATILMTGHENGHVLLWDMVSPADRASKGSIRLLHAVDVFEKLPADDTITVREITSLGFCHESRLLAAGFNTGELALFAFTPREQVNSTVDSPLAEQQEIADNSKHAGYHLLLRVQPHELPISKLAILTGYGFVAVADASGEISLVNVATKTTQAIQTDQTLADDEAVNVECLLLTELVQTTEIPTGDASINPSESKRSPGKPRRASRGDSNAPSEGAGMTVHQEPVPVLFVGRGAGKLELYHVHTGVKIGETLVDEQKMVSLSSVIMVDLDGKRVEISGKRWPLEESAADGSNVDAATVGVEMLQEPLTDDSAERIQTEDASIEEPPCAETVLTKEMIAEAVAELAAEDAIALGVEVAPSSIEVPSVSAPWSRYNVVEATLLPGPLGLRLFTEIEEHGVVYSFVPDVANAATLEASGVGIGHAIVSINRVDVTSLNRRQICRLLEKLRDHEKLMGLARGFDHPVISANIPPAIEDTTQRVSFTGVAAPDLDQPRFLVCTCGRMIHLLQASLPRASEIATGAKEMPAQPLASVELRSPALITSIIRVPTEDRVEHCLAVVDQSNELYIISLLSLTIVWQSDGNGILGNTLVVGISFGMSYGGELVIANEFGEIERFSFLSEQAAMETAMLTHSTIKTSLYLPERVFQFSSVESPKKKGGIADAGKMFKKLVMSVKQDADLKKVFQFSSAEDERQQLFGARTATSEAANADEQGTAKVSKGMNATKDALMQAHQVILVHLNTSSATGSNPLWL